jgi:Phytanoyl-CoA dioxygenase (PhyH)
MKQYGDPPSPGGAPVIANGYLQKAESQQAEDAVVDHLVAELEQNGVVVLPPLFTPLQIEAMQSAFEARLGGMRWNDLDGYEKEPLRDVLQDVLMLEQGFVNLALHPLVAKTLKRYIGSGFALTEAKGWRSLPTKRDFQGWHGDYWYDETKVQGIAKEVKLAMYLTNVRSGAFNYIKGSHQKQHPRVVQNSELEDVPKSSILEILGVAGTAFLFDSSGIHKQGVPILQPRRAVFYNYHDPQVPLAKEAVDYYRYHPLALNAAFLGNLSEEDQRILGFGNTTRYVPAFRRTTEYKNLYKAFSLAFGARLAIADVHERSVERIKRVLKLKR